MVSSAREVATSHQGGRARPIAALDKVHFPREPVELRFNRNAQLSDILCLDRTGGGQAAERVKFGPDHRHGCPVIGEKFRLRGQKIATCSAFRAPDVQEERIGLVLNLNGMDDGGTVAPGSVDKECRCGADCDKHQKSRREQENLPQCADTPCVRGHGKIASSGTEIDVPRAKEIAKRRFRRLVPLSLTLFLAKSRRQPACWPARYCSSQ